MSLDLSFFAGYKDGTQALSATNTTNYVAGQPLGVMPDGSGLGVVTGGNGSNYVGMALSDRYLDARNGKLAYAARLSIGVLYASYSPALDQLIIADGISAGDASFGRSNLGLFAESLGDPNYNLNTINPAALGITLITPFDSTQTYVPGQLLYVDTTTGLWTNQAGNAGASPVAHGLVMPTNAIDGDGQSGTGLNQKFTISTF
jgi:hypothetical protein